MVEEGTVDAKVFDADSLLSLHGLSAELQDRVLVYLESERIFLMNARSKSGFLKAACDKAKVGALDVMGMGVKDPWKAMIQSVATPKQTLIELTPAEEWLEKHGKEPAQLNVDVSADKDVGVRSIALAVDLALSVAAVKARLSAIGVTFPVHKMKLKGNTVGFLRDERTLAFYNIRSGTTLQLVYKTRGGLASRRDHTIYKVPSWRSGG